MLTVFTFLFAPRKTIAQISARPAWLATFAILASLTIALTVLLHPFVANETLAHLPDSATPHEKEVIRLFLQHELIKQCFFLPIRLLAGWAAFAFTLYLIVRSLSPLSSLQFKKIFTLTLHAEFILLLGKTATLISLYVANDTITNRTSLIPFSLAAFIPTNDIITFSLYNSLNFFTLGYTALLIFGVLKCTELSFPKSLLAVLLAWFVYLLFNIGTIGFLRETMHFLI
ncbi:MAG: hypothetical protein HY961_03600 [Ignavibacteriae bacterium]|nr:hypothetical protein [Ignavibacteriota bacterium]